MSRIALVMALAVLVPGRQAVAQATPTPAPQALTLADALQFAVDHYPSVKAQYEEVAASIAGVEFAKAGYLPRLDAVWQSNRATANNIFGQLLPQAAIPAMSGPVLPATSAATVWGSATGALFSWDAIDFGLRRANVRSAEAAVVRARTSESLARLEVQRAVGAAFLAVVAAAQAVRAAQADVDRRDVLARAAHTLVDNQLRAGAEASRADAERAAAATRAILARQTLVLAETTFAQMLGVPGQQVTVSAASLPAVPPMASIEAAVAGHPMVQSHVAAVDEARAHEDVLRHTDRPRLLLQSSLFARGSGAHPDGLFDGGADGLGLERTNWAAGVQVVFPNLFDFASLRARRNAAAATTRAESARYDEAVLTVTAQQKAAAAMVDAARAMAANTPVQLAAAEQSETQARARYQAGLTSIVEVAEAQNLLAQAEYQDSLARVDVWRALLADAVARGDLAPFLMLVRNSEGNR